jgi:mono/diheme cytochrome c family protein
MKQLSPLKPRLRPATSLALATAAIYAAALVFVTGAETPPAPKAKKKADKPAIKRKLTGAELYALNCNRCHNERYPTEFAAAQWKTIMMEMRVRANLPAEQARAILKYLQEESGTP